MFTMPPSSAQKSGWARNKERRAKFRGIRDKLRNAAPCFSTPPSSLAKKIAYLDSVAELAAIECSALRLVALRVAAEVHPADLRHHSLAPGSVHVRRLSRLLSSVA